MPPGRYDGPVRLLFRTVRFDHALRLCTAEEGRLVRRKAKSGFVAHDDVVFDLHPDRVRRVFAASGSVDGRDAGDFVWELLGGSEIALRFGDQAGAIWRAMQERWDMAA